MIRARFELECACCERVVEQGEEIGRVDGLWCCEQCVKDNGGESEK